MKPGLPYLDLHKAAHVKIADLLHERGIIREKGEEAVKLGLTGPFFPHGLGHFLGLQVHESRSPEIAGRRARRAAEQFPYLRTTRTIEPGQVFTVEPGLYFIDMLLRPHRSGPQKSLFDWKAIDRLSACGGIRIEDNVLVTKDGHRNLTRAHI